ncbi:hypothetical protein LSAT2_006748 [Lamellibrachia satsuma]|nr:hypothetical protein LSAT2_006748 [Lamellibrachia satsuma]
MKTRKTMPMTSIERINATLNTMRFIGVFKDDSVKRRPTDALPIVGPTPDRRRTDRSIEVALSKEATAHIEITAARGFNLH